MTCDRDFLDEIVHARTVRNPGFARMVALAYERRVALRAGSSGPPDGAARPGAPGRTEAADRSDT